MVLPPISEHQHIEKNKDTPPQKNQKQKPLQKVAPHKCLSHKIQSL